MSKRANRSSLSVDRRQLLSMGAAVGAAGLAAGKGISQSAAQTSGFPTMKVAQLSDVSVGVEIEFDYPDGDSPAVLLRMDSPVEGGIGPDQTIVAYSRLCTHKGCPVSYNAAHKMLICPCHWSSFDPAKKGRLIIGQASQGLPQITLRLTDGAVEAVGVEGLIYGRQQNIL